MLKRILVRWWMKLFRMMMKLLMFPLIGVTISNWKKVPFSVIALLWENPGSLLQTFLLCGYGDGLPTLSKSLKCLRALLRVIDRIRLLITSQYVKSSTSDFYAGMKNQVMLMTHLLTKVFESLTLKEQIAFYNTNMSGGGEVWEEGVWKHGICGICVSHYL